MDLGELHKLIDKYFNEEEIQTLCFYLDVEFDSLPAKGKSAKARELIQLCVRNGMFDKLVQECQEQRPHIRWIESIEQGDSEIHSVKTPSTFSSIQSSMPVHPYSGEWEIENNFTLWKGYKLRGDDTVYFHGKAFLLISADGKKGFGTQLGNLHVSIYEYKARLENANRINRAYVNEDGSLCLNVEVVIRNLVHEEGVPRDERFREDLFGSGKFKLQLYPVSGKSQVLQGKHIYKVGNKVYQAAEEIYKYSDFRLL